MRIWANSTDVPGIICANISLDRDTIRGQAGWDRGINFSDINDLAGKLETFDSGQIRRLAIHTHGGPGSVFINGQHKPALTLESVSQFETVLRRIGLLITDIMQNPDERRDRPDLRDWGVIFFVGCLAGSGRPGTDLLIRLSRQWPNRKIVAFGTIGYADGARMRRSGDTLCNEAGMRDTDALFPGEADDHATEKWPNLQAWPWATENSPHAKVALNGRIITGAHW